MGGPETVEHAAGRASGRGGGDAGARRGPGDGGGTAGEPVASYENGRVCSGTGFGTRSPAVADGRFADPAGRRVAPACAHAHIAEATDKASARRPTGGVCHAWNTNTVVMPAAAKAFHGQRGLDARNLPHLVKAARKRGPWVAAHVGTVAGPRAAAASGVAAHVPG